MDEIVNNFLLTGNKFFDKRSADTQAQSETLATHAGSKINYNLDSKNQRSLDVPITGKSKLQKT